VFLSRTRRRLKESASQISTAPSPPGFMAPAGQCNKTLWQYTAGKLTHLR
jgi:hypothetical protein